MFTAPRLSFKKGVRLHNLQPQAVVAMTIAAFVYALYGKECVVTSVNDGKHSRGSLHFVGAAFDLRTRHLEDQEQREVITLKLREALGDQYDVVLESDHIHVEYQPKGI